MVARRRSNLFAPVNGRDGLRYAPYDFHRDWSPEKAHPDLVAESPVYPPWDCQWIAPQPIPHLNNGQHPDCQRVSSGWYRLTDQYGNYWWRAPGDPPRLPQPAVVPPTPIWRSQEYHTFNPHIRLDSLNEPFPQSVIDWNLYTSPRTLASKKCIRRARILEQPATTPGVRKMSLNFRQEHNKHRVYMDYLCRLWGPIVIRPGTVDANTSNASTHTVTVDDVVRGISNYFNTPITNLELYAFSGDSVVTDRMNKAYYHRTEHIRRHDEYGLLGGKLYPTRADLLREHVNFVGIENYVASWDDHGRTVSGTVVLGKY